MFGKPVQNNGASPPRKAAADVAQIEGGGLVQVIVTELRPIAFSLFLNDTEVPQIDVDSLSISIEVPADGTSTPTVRATLYRYVTTVRAAKRSSIRSCSPAPSRSSRSAAVWRSPA